MRWNPMQGGRWRRRLPLLAVGAAALLYPSAASAVPTIFDPGTGVSYASPQQADLYLDWMHDLGGDIVRLRPSWDDPELEQLDYLVAGTRRRGMEVLLTPVGPATPLTWGPYGITPGPAPAGPTVTEYAGFVGELGRRYPDVHRWAIWNEPDLPSIFPLPNDAGDTPGQSYRNLFLAAQSALVASGHQAREVLIGETHPGHPGRTLGFLRDVLCLNRRWKLKRGCDPIAAGGWAHHPYIMATWPWYTSKSMGTADLPRLNRALWRAARAGASIGKLPIYVTEFGVSGGDRLAGQMLSAAEWVMTRHRWVKSFAQYSLRDDWWEHGLMRPDGSPKWTLIAFTHSLFVIRRGARAVVWGHLRAQVGKTSVSVIDGGRLTRRLAVTTDQQGYFKVVTPWRKDRQWCVAGGTAVRSFRLNPPRKVNIQIAPFGPPPPTGLSNQVHPDQAPVNPGC